MLLQLLRESDIHGSLNILGILLPLCLLNANSFPRLSCPNLLTWKTTCILLLSLEQTFKTQQTGQVTLASSLGTIWLCCVYLVTKLCPTLLWPHGLHPARRLCLCDFLGRNTAVGCHFLLQGIFLTQGLNRCVLHWERLFTTKPTRKPLYHLCHASFRCFWVYSYHFGSK